MQYLARVNIAGHVRGIRACVGAWMLCVEFVSSELGAIGKYIVDVNLARCRAIRDSRHSITRATVSAPGGPEIL